MQGKGWRERGSCSTHFAPIDAQRAGHAIPLASGCAVDGSDGSEQGKCAGQPQDAPPRHASFLSHGPQVLRLEQEGYVHEQ